MKILYVVIPCYNEEEVLPETSERLKEKLNNLIKDKKISDESKIMFVNDGSKDKTWEMIKKYNSEDKIFRGVNLSRNRGQQNALLAGLMTAKEYADIVISMDADLQDDINVMDEMIEENNNGCEIVYGVRSSRKKDSFFKKVTAEGFYKFMNFMGVNVVFNHSDCRLMSKRALNELATFREVNLFLRGLVPLIGFKTGIAYYERHERFAGESKYPLKKMISFAIDGITSFSIKPLEFIFKIGLFLLLVSFGLLVAVIVRAIMKLSITLLLILWTIYLVGSLIMIGMGVIGTYIGKTYIEVKDRPRFIIEEVL